MNILILSCGTRNKIVEYFMREMKGEGKVIATDCSELAPALYEADTFYIVPRITEGTYVNEILDICKKEKIDGVFSLIDPELSLLAENSGKFAEIGTTVIGSAYALCEMALDKWKMYKWLTNNGFLCAKTYMDKESFYRELSSGTAKFPVFVKPRCGSASIAISKVYEKATLEVLLKDGETDYIIQEFLDGQEIGADCYVDLLSGEIVSVFTKKKIVMRAGETDKSVSFKDERLFEEIKRFLQRSGFIGQVDIDIFDIGGSYYISEVNPRFGGDRKSVV